MATARLTLRRSRRPEEDEQMTKGRIKLFESVKDDKARVKGS